MEKQLIPKLRFPEFKSEFVKFEFSEIAKRGKKSYNPNKDSENLPCIELESLTQETGQLIKTFDSINLKSNKTRFSKNEVLFGKLRPYLKKYLLTTCEGVCTSEIWVFQGKLVSNPFLYYLIQTDKFNFEANVSSGSKMPRTDWDYLSGIKFSIPNNSKEQQKIASFLTDVDAKITQLTKKKDLLEQYKKGVMQKIFSQELRFKPDLSGVEGDDNGNEFPKWGVRKLGELCNITTGKLDANAMVENGEYRFYTCAKDFFKIDKYSFDLEALLISGNGANVGYVHYYKGKFNAYQRTYVLYNLNQSYSYIKYFLDKFIQKRIHREKKDGNTPYIVMETLTEMIINVPSIEEQTKIANFLSDIDTKIEAINTNIENSKAFKKGLLQQMFV